jgi:hypothetical protein
MASIVADQAEPNDVVLAPDGKVYQYNGEYSWSHMDLVGYYGAPWTPQGDLTLLVRNGVPWPPGEVQE